MGENVSLSVLGREESRRLSGSLLVGRGIALKSV